MSSCLCSTAVTVGSRGWCIRQGPSKHGVSSRLLACSGTRNLSPFSALVSTPAAPNRNLSLWNMCCGTSHTSWSRRCEKIRWKECENELFPRERLLLRSSLAPRPSVPAPRRAPGGWGGAGGLCGDTATSAADTPARVEEGQALLCLRCCSWLWSFTFPLSNTCFPVTCIYLGTCLPISVLEQIFIKAESCSPGSQWKPSVPFGTRIPQLRAQWQLSTQVSSDCVTVGPGYIFPAQA